MTDLKITTVNDFDQDGIFPLRTVRVNDSVKVRTPASANVLGKLRDYEEIHPKSRGVNELYRTVGGDDLDEAMRSSDGGQINSDLEEQYEKTREDELNITFTKYTEASTLGPTHATYLANLHATYSDIITVPMMPKLVRNIEDGLSDPLYRSFKKSIVAFLNQAKDRHSGKPIMGLIPRLGWEYVDDLIGLYEDHDVLAYAFDFDRCKVTTGTQLSMVQPVMESVASRGIEEHVLTYAINPSPGVRDESIGARPASDISSFGLGIDIVGGRHVPFRADQETFEKIEAQQTGDEGPEFRLFDRDEWVYRDVPVSELSEFFPEESGFTAEQVAERVRRSPSNAKYRLQHLVNGEQQALAAADLREALVSGDAYSTVRGKVGVTVKAQTAFQETRAQFDDERFQSGLGEF